MNTQTRELIRDTGTMPAGFHGLPDELQGTAAEILGNRERVRLDDEPPTRSVKTLFAYAKRCNRADKAAKRMRKAARRE